MCQRPAAVAPVLFSTHLRLADSARPRLVVPVRWLCSTLDRSIISIDSMHSLSSWLFMVLTSDAFLRHVSFLTMSGVLSANLRLAALTLLSQLCRASAVASEACATCVRCKSSVLGRLFVSRHTIRLEFFAFWFLHWRSEACALVGAWCDVTLTSLSETLLQWYPLLKPFPAAKILQQTPTG